METAQKLRADEWQAAQRVRALGRRVFEAGETAAAQELEAAEKELEDLAGRRAQAEKQESASGVIVAAPAASNLFGPDTTGLEVSVSLKTSSVPTSLVHLFDAKTDPLVEYAITNTNEKTKRIRLVSYVDGYSAHAVDTIEAKQYQTARILQLPTFHPERIRAVQELTRATVNVLVEDLDAKTELHRTVPVWLLARTTAPLAVKDPSTGVLRSLKPYLGAYVTPNAESVMSYVRTAADKTPRKRFVGYQAAEEVEPQVKAVFETLKESGVVYVNSIIDFAPDTAWHAQRVRLPRESLCDRQANCIDGTLLMASLLEAVSLHPALVIVPRHAFLAWETGVANGQWQYCETTMIGTSTFEEACAKGADNAAAFLPPPPGEQRLFPLRDLRAAGITPLE